MTDHQADVRFCIGVACRMSYTNHRGEVAERHFLPLEVYHGTSLWHPNPGWILRAFDYERQAVRDFSLNGFLGPVSPVPSARPVRANMIAEIDETS